MDAEGRARETGVWRFGCAWMRPLCAAAPWLTLATLLFTFAVASVRFTRAPGTEFELPPSSGTVQAEDVDAAVVVLPPADGRGSTAFFDDSRFDLSDKTEYAAFAARVEAASQRGVSSIALMADAAVPLGDTMKAASAIRASGVRRIVVAGE